MQTETERQQAIQYILHKLMKIHWLCNLTSVVELIANGDQVAISFNNIYI